MTMNNISTLLTRKLRRKTGNCSVSAVSSLHEGKMRTKFLTTIQALSSKLGRNGTGVLFAAIGALSGLKRDLAIEFGVLFAGMGVLRRRAGAMSTGIIIMFAAVGVC